MSHRFTSNEKKTISSLLSIKQSDVQACSSVLINDDESITFRKSNFYGELSLKIREANIQIQIYFYYKMCKIT